MELVKGYNAEGITPTLRQVHYRLATERAGGYLNLRQHYKQLSQLLVRARKEGDLSWWALADHVRYRWWIRPKGEPDLNTLVKKAAENIGEDPWLSQHKQLLVWLEKDALADLVWRAIGGYCGKVT